MSSLQNPSISTQIEALNDFYQSLSNDDDNLDYSENTDFNDEKYELLINDTNMVYNVKKLDDSESGSDTDNFQSENESETSSDFEDENLLSRYYLEPVEDFWGCLLNYNLLDEFKVFVFDFGSELYVWSGRCSSTRRKKQQFH